MGLRMFDECWMLGVEESARCRLKWRLRNLMISVGSQEHLLDLGHSLLEIIQTKGHICNKNINIGYRIHQKLCDLQLHSHDPKTNAEICLDICHGLDSKRNRSQLCFPSALPGLLDALPSEFESSQVVSDL